MLPSEAMGRASTSKSRTGKQENQENYFLLIFLFAQNSPVSKKFEFGVRKILPGIVAIGLTVNQGVHGKQHLVSQENGDECGSFIVVAPSLFEAIRRSAKKTDGNDSRAPAFSRPRTCFRWSTP